jgi:hypothetical protein
MSFSDPISRLLAADMLASTITTSDAYHSSGGVSPRGTGDSRHRLVTLPRGPDDGGPPRTLCKGARRGKGSSARAVDSRTAHGSGNGRHTLGVQRLAPDRNQRARAWYTRQGFRDCLETKGCRETKWIQCAARRSARLVGLRHRLLERVPPGAHCTGGAERARWGGQFWVDHCLPFGLRSATGTFGQLAEFVAEVGARRFGVKVLIWVDDLPVIRPTGLAWSEADFLRPFEACGFRFNAEKQSTFGTTFPFLGYVWDLVQCEVSFLPGKVEDTLALVDQFLSPT